MCVAFRSIASLPGVAPGYRQPRFRIRVVHSNGPRWYPGSHAIFGDSATYYRIRPYDATFADIRTGQDDDAVADPYVIFHDGFCVRGEKPIGGSFKRATLGTPLVDPMVVVSNNYPAAHEHIISYADTIRGSNVHKIADNYVVTDYQHRFITIAVPVAFNGVEPQIIKSLEGPANLKAADSPDSATRSEPYAFCTQEARIKYVPGHRQKPFAPKQPRAVHKLAKLSRETLGPGITGFMMSVRGLR
jgi:hypothetical protein